jgi:hypothetical protein
VGHDYVWNQERARDRHLKPGGPKRLLAIDGGGIRGLLSCGILKSIEDTLRARLPTAEERERFVLADYYDFIGGTSTGSIVAAWLATGRPVSELQELYLSMGPAIFGKSRPFAMSFNNKFDAEELSTQLQTHLRDITLDSDDLVTGFGVSAKRMDTGSGWLLANNPRAPYWDGDANNRPNAELPVREMVRASAAAPAYFDHVSVAIEHELAPAAFMDGAVAGLNNPSMAFWLYVTSPGYGLGWKTGEHELLITSVGTGEYRQRFTDRHLKRMPAIQRAIFSLAGSIQDVVRNQVQTMQALSRPLNPYPINSEVDFLAGPDEKLRGEGHAHCIAERPLFSFQRFDVRLDAGGLAAMGVTDNGEAYGPRMIRNLQAMDCVTPVNLKRLCEIGEAAGKLRVRGEHFPAAFNTPAMAGNANVALSLGEDTRRQVGRTSRGRWRST